MDISFVSGNDKFNYRVCAMIVSDGKILAMHDDRSPYYYLPGGRVAIGETAEDAIIREVQEELGVILKIVRPLWLNQAFFTEDVDNLNYHELCIYFLMDIADTDLLTRGKQFISNEGSRLHTFEWLAAWLVSPENHNPYNEKTWEILDIFGDMGISANEGNIIFPEGNALKYLADYFTTQAPINPYIENPQDLRCISFAANGDVLGGNVYRQDIVDLLREYKPRMG